MANPFADNFGADFKPRGDKGDGKGKGFGQGAWNDNGWGRNWNDNGFVPKKKAIFYENTILDLSVESFQFDVSGEHIALKDRKHFERVCIGSHLSGLREAAKVQRVSALLVRSADSWDTTIQRTQELSRYISLDMSDEAWDRFITCVKEAAVNCGERVVSVESYLKRKTKPDVTETLINFMRSMSAKKEET